jgi:alpha-1,3-mannosyltransferase
LLLVLPAIGVILLLGRGFWPGLRLAWLMAQVQFAIGIPFIMKNSRGYAARAFELSREFKFEWTVNWRMLGEDVFLSKTFAIFLLACHVTALLVFISQRWLQPTGRPLSAMMPSFLQLKSPFTLQEQLRISHYVTPEYVMTTMLSANVIGLLFARSLHYQFYAYLAWASPYLLWRATEDPFIVLLIWAAQEWAWNVFPSTDLSSRVTVGAMLATVVLVYRGTARLALPSSQTRKIEAKNK